MESFKYVILLYSWIDKIKETNNENLVVHFCRLMGNIINYENGKIDKKSLNELIDDKLTDNVTQIINVSCDNSEKKDENELNLENVNKVLNNKLINNIFQVSDNSNKNLENKMMKLYIMRFIIQNNDYDDTENSFESDFKCNFEKFMKKYNSDM
jgi:hypothetical protein